MTMIQETSRVNEGRRWSHQRTQHFTTMKRVQACAATVAATTLSLAGVLAFSGSSGAASAPSLGAASDFAVLAHAGVGRLAGATVVGNVGFADEGTTTTPFADTVARLLNVVTGTLDVANGAVTTALGAAGTAYETARGDTPTSVISGADLHGGTLTPGVYSVVGPMSVGGILQLNALGHANADFIIQVPSTLVTAPGSSVVLEGGAQPQNVIWQVGQSATLGHGSSFVGSLLADHGVTLGAGANLVGRVVSLLGGVNLGTSAISLPTATTPTSGTTGTALPSAGTVVPIASGLTTSLVPIIGGLVPVVASLAPRGLVGTLVTSATNAAAAATSTTGVAPSAGATTPTGTASASPSTATTSVSGVTGLIPVVSGLVPTGSQSDPAKGVAVPTSSASSGLLPSLSGLLPSALNDLTSSASAALTPAVAVLAPALSTAVPVATSGHGTLVHGKVAPGTSSSGGTTLKPHASSVTTTTVPASASGTIPLGAPATGEGGMAGSGFAVLGLLGLAALALSFTTASIARTRRRRLA